MERLERKEYVKSLCGTGLIKADKHFQALNSDYGLFSNFIQCLRMDGSLKK